MGYHTLSCDVNELIGVLNQRWKEWYLAEKHA